MIINMPKWQSYIVTTTKPLFSPEQCQDIIDAGHAEKQEEAQVGINSPDDVVNKKKRKTTISWIAFKKLPQMYQKIEQQLSVVNLNHFGFENVQITEPGQFTEYSKGGFYDWHMDLDFNGQHQPPVRKISMTCLLSDPSTFKGGDLEFIEKNNIPSLKQGQAIFFASFIRHRVAPIKKGIRRSLVMWFGGTPFK